jgi:hypothetical protein
MGVDEFDHLPGSAKGTWVEQARRAREAGRHYRRRCRALSFQLDIAEKRCKALERENALLEAQVEVLELTIEGMRRTGGRPREDAV